MPDLSRFNKFMSQYMPLILQEEMKKREVMRWLEKELQEIMARKQAEEELIGKRGESQILTGAYTPSFFERQTVPSEAYLTQLRRTQPEIYKRLGFQAGETIETETDKAIKAAGRILMAQQAGEPYAQEDAQEVLKYIGQKIPGEAAADIVKQKEGTAERGIRGREAAIQEKLIPIREKEVSARWKEIGGQIGDMTAKEAREALFKLGQERRRYQATLETKTDDLGDLLSEDRLNLIKSNVNEIKQLEDKISSKFSKEFGKEYEAIAQDLKSKGYTAADLDANKQIRGLLTERGYNIEELKKYMR